MIGRLGLLVVLLYIPASVVAGPGEREFMLAAVDRLRARGDLRGALAQASRAREQYPADLSVHARYQDIRRSLGEGPAVREEYRRRSLKHRTVAELCMYARLLDGEASVRAYRRALRRDPGFFWGQLGIGVAYLRTGKLKQARDHLERACSIRPKHPAPKIRLGQLHERANRPDQALEQYQLAALVAPGVADPLFHQAFALMALKRIPEAEEVARSLLGHSSPDGKVLGRIALGALRAQRRDHAGAVKEYEKAIAQSGRYGVHALALLGDSLTDLGRFEEADKAYGNALQREPSHLKARLGLGYLRYKQGDLAGADKQFAAASRSAAKGDVRNQAESLFFRGVVADERGRPAAALSWFKKAIDRDGRVAEYHLALALAYEELGRLSLAIRSYVAAASLDPGDALSLLQAGLLEEERRHGKRALELVEAALARDRTLLDAHLAAGSICQDLLGDAPGAARHYRAFLAAGGKSEEVAVWLEQLGTDETRR